MTSFKNNWLVKWATAGLLLGVGFIFPGLWLLGLVGIAFSIYLAIHESSYKYLFVGGLVAWTIKSAMALIWSWSVYPMDWISIDLGFLQLILIFFWWFTGSLWLGFGGAFFAVFCRLLVQYTSVVVAYITIPFLWLVSEMFGSLVFSIMTIGPGGSVTTALSFGYVGYLLSSHSVLIQIAQVAGVYSLGILVVAIGVVLVYVYQRTDNHAYIYGLLGLLFLTSFILLPQNENSSDVYKVAVIDTDFRLDVLRSSVGRGQVNLQIESAVQAALVLEPDYILLPEDSRFFDQRETSDVAAATFAFRAGSPEVIIVDSGRASDKEKAVVQSFIYNGKEKVVDQSHKRYLVPQGEFMPTLYKNLLKLFGRDEVIDEFSKTVAFEIGSKTTQADHRAGSPGVLFCFESVSPWGVRTILAERGRVPFIAHPVSHSWFNDSNVLQSQLTSMLQVQAVWNQQYIVSAGNRVSSQTFTPMGGVIYPKEINQGENWQLSVVEIPML